MSTPFPTPLFQPTKSHNIVELLQEKILSLESYQENFNDFEGFKEFQPIFIPNKTYEIKTPSPSPIESRYIKI